VAAFITTSHPLRHPLQIIVCVGQIYGLILYYATSMFDHYYKDVTYSRPEFLYFWFYYFFMNFIWMVIPGSKLPQIPHYDSATDSWSSQPRQQRSKDRKGLLDTQQVAGKWFRQWQRKEESITS
jgi:hypothetical protein